MKRRNLTDLVLGGSQNASSGSPLRYCRNICSSLYGMTHLECAAVSSGHTGCVNTVQFNSSGDLLVSGSDDTRLVVWDVNSDEKSEITSWDTEHSANIFSAKFMPFTDDRVIVSVAGDASVRCSVLREGGDPSITVFPQHTDRVKKIGQDPQDSHVFITCAEDGSVRQFDLRIAPESNDQGLSIVQLQLEQNGLSVDPSDPMTFCVSGRDAVVRVYDRRAGFGIQSPSLQFVPLHYRDSRIDCGHISGVEYSYDGKQICATYMNELIYLFDVRNSSAYDEGNMNVVEDGGPPVFAESKRAMNVNNIPSVCGHNTYSMCYRGHRSAVTVKEVNFVGPRSEFVTSGSDDGRFFFWEKDSGRCVQGLPGDTDVVNCVVSHPYDHIVVTSGIEADVKWWTPTSQSSTVPTDLQDIVESNSDSLCSDMNFGGGVIPLSAFLQLIRQGALNVDVNETDGEDDSDDEEGEGEPPGIACTQQ